MWSSCDLIVAAATPPGAGARAIVRIAGDGLDDLLARLFAVDGEDGSEDAGRPRLLTARPAVGGPLADWGPVPLAILRWRGACGPLGAPLAEVQLPASAPFVDAVVAAACRCGARPARGGEFSLRAFLAGRLDLLQAEAVLSVVDARTPAELSVALDRLAGGVGRGLDVLRDALLDLAADVEATIDFADERTPDAAPAADAAAWNAIDGRLAAAERELDVISARLSSRDPGSGAELARLVLAGPPNIGKSSLFNALVGREAALVADEPGTTRDWLAARIEPAPGLVCILVDLAGLDPAGLDAETGVPPPELPAEGRAAVEVAARARAREEIARADVVLSCRDASAAAAGDGPPAGVRDAPARWIDVLTRCDLAPPAAGGGIRTSSRTGEGLVVLRSAIAAAVAGRPPAGSPATLRMRVGVTLAREAVAAARAEAAGRGAWAGRDEAVVAGLVREAVAAVDEVTGRRIDTDLVDRIFSRHCIGK